MRHADLEDVEWDGAVFDASTKFPTRFPIPENLIWFGEGVDTRQRQLEKYSGAAGRRKRPKKLSVKSLLSDAELAEIAAGVQDDPALPEGYSLELLPHPVYGADLSFSLCLEFCQYWFDLTNEELTLNLWYRCERFVRLYDGIHGGYSDGDHHRADQLLECGAGSGLSGAEFNRLFERIEQEVNEMLSDYNPDSSAHN